MATVVEIFAGAGGAALGLKAAGFDHLACIEQDPDACDTLRAAGLPCVQGDVRDPDLYESHWVGCDLLWSSFPCQAWSQAGKRQGSQDDRNGWPWTVDVIDCLEPTWFIAENVVGLLRHRGACDDGCVGSVECPRAYFDQVIIKQLRQRFDWVGFRVLNASSFGVPQHRKRVLIVAGPHPVDWPSMTHGKPSSQIDLFGQQLLPWKTAGEALGITGYLRTEMTGASSSPASHPAATVPGSGNQYHHQSDPGMRLIGGGRNPQSPSTAHLRNYRDITDEPCTTICAITHRVSNAGPWMSKPSPAVLASEVKGSGPGANPEKMQRASDALYLETGRRRLTTAECATLQDFPPGHPFMGTKKAIYRQIGNAVPPKLAEVMGAAVLKKIQGAVD
jgi:DNA (cytosine-5)-methyltransferase 1